MKEQQSTVTSAKFMWRGNTPAGATTKNIYIFVFLFLFSFFLFFFFFLQFYVHFSPSGVSICTVADWVLLIDVGSPQRRWWAVATFPALRWPTLRFCFVQVLYLFQKKLKFWSMMWRYGSVQVTERFFSLEKKKDKVTACNTLKIITMLGILACSL